MCVTPQEIIRFGLKPMRMHHAFRETTIVTFQENPSARMQNMHQSKDLRAPLPSPLFKRILVRECKKCLRAMVVQDPCHRHFYRESLCDNKNRKNEKNDMSTFSENPWTGTTTTNNTFWGAIVFLAFKGDVFQTVWKSWGENKKKKPDVVHLAQQQLFIKELIGFNNHLTHGPPRFLPTRSSSRRGLHPPLRGGSWWSKEIPVHPIPSYPALSREDTTSWKHGRPRTHTSRATKWTTSYTHQLHGFIHVCHVQKYKSSVIACSYWLEEGVL